MGLFDKVKKVADQAQQLGRTVKSELESRGIDLDGDDDASRRRRAALHDEQRAQHDAAVVDYLGFDPFTLVDEAAVSSALGFPVERSGSGGGDYEVGPTFRGTAKHDDRSVSVCFLYPDDLHSTTWSAAEQAEYYATAGDDPLAEWPEVGERSWLVSEDMVVVLVRGRAFYVYASGDKPARVSTASLKELARVVAGAVPPPR